MAHAEQMDFVRGLRSRFPADFRRRKVLEVGSLDVNGTVRPFFERCEYVGLDVQAGPGVDVVLGKDAWDWDEQAEEWDVVISCEMLEHSETWADDVARMTACLRSGGLLILTAAGVGRPEHGTPATGETWGLAYYGNVVGEALLTALGGEMEFEHWGMEFDGGHCDIRFWGRRW